MTVGYKAIRETFTTQVLLNKAERIIDVKYIDGPFKYLDNRWRFEPTRRRPAQRGRTCTSSSITSSRAASSAR
jgi:ribosome-associated toxin RatA of RatAB toxin-antitoxin module